jgi:hypothetical protein
MQIKVLKPTVAARSEFSTCYSDLLYETAQHIVDTVKYDALR